jgi:hypothetical protein
LGNAGLRNVTMNRNRSAAVVWLMVGAPVPVDTR